MALIVVYLKKAFTALLAFVTMFLYGRLSIFLVSTLVVLLPFFLWNEMIPRDSVKMLV